MKKFISLLVVCTTFLICTYGANSTILLVDSFNYKADTLTAKYYKNSENTPIVDNLEWYYTTSTKAKIQVVDTALTKSGYCDQKSGKSIKFSSNVNKAVRAFNNVSSGSIYYSMLMNVRNVNTNTSKNSIVMISNQSTTSGSCFAQLRYMNDGDNYKLGITKIAEMGVRWTSSIPTDSTILVVVRYDFKEGEKNDEVYMWINPTQNSENKPTTWCVQDTANPQNPDVKWGANQKNDASSFNWIYLCPGAHTANIIIDEVRVSTKWTDLFGGTGGDEPSLSATPAIVKGGDLFQGDQKVCDIKVTGFKLSDDVAIAHTNKQEVTLSKSKITKGEKVEETFTATIKADAVGAQIDTVTFKSGTLTDTIFVTWTTVAVANCASVKALKDSVNGATASTKFVRLTGEAIVTRDTVIDEKIGLGSVRTLIIQDATGATKLYGGSGILDNDNMVGSKIKNIVLLNGDVALGAQMFSIQTKPTVVSTGNEVEPQVVTLATLQANAADYLLEVVQVQKVTFAGEGGTFKGDSLYKITQGAQNANVKIEMGKGFIGVTIPGTANVTGFSMNTSGSAILPRSTEDIIDANPVLLKNGSFEKYKESSFGGKSTNFTDWTAQNMWAVEAEKNDVIEGETALKTNSELKKDMTLTQEIDCSNYVENDEFIMRICHKDLNTQDSLIVLDSYWSASMGGTRLEQPEELKVLIPYSSDWDTTTIKVTKPEGAKYFVFGLIIKKNAQVLLDNFTFEYVEPTKPYFVVLPEKRNYSFTTNINSDTVVAQLTIRQRNLKQPVKLVWSVGTDKTVYSVSKSEITAAEETVEVKFKSSKTGKFNGALNIMDDESTEASLYNTTISFSATVIDPSKTPEITVTPMEFDTFRCKAYEEVTDTIFITSSNCSDYVRCWANEQTGPDSLWGFGISDSYISKNTTDTVILTFAPKKAGNYTARLKVFTTGVDTIFINVAGVAEEGQPEPIVVDWDTTFTWKQDNPYKELNEQFDHADTCYNKTLKTTDWQNVVLTGQRPWWGYKSDTTKQAKISSYYSYETPGTKPMENWLVTPALDYKNATKQVFTFRVMGWAMQEQQTAKLEVYYIDATKSNDIWFQHIEEIDSMIPAKDSELNGQWTDVYLSLAGQESISDVFFMAFKFTDNGGTNGIVYYVDDVTWGVKDIPSGIQQTQTSPTRMSDVHKFVYKNQLFIEKNGRLYNVLGQQQ